MSCAFDTMLLCPASSDTSTRCLFPTFSGSICSYVLESRRIAETWMPPLWAKAALPTYGWLTGILTLAISLIYRAVFVSVRRLSSPMHSYPSFSCRFGMMEHRLAFPQRSRNRSSFLAHAGHQPVRHLACWQRQVRNRYGCECRAERLVVDPLRMSRCSRSRAEDCRRSYRT